MSTIFYKVLVRDDDDYDIMLWRTECFQATKI